MHFFACFNLPDDSKTTENHIKRHPINSVYSSAIKIIINLNVFSVFTSNQRQLNVVVFLDRMNLCNATWCLFIHLVFIMGSLDTIQYTQTINNLIIKTNIQLSHSVSSNAKSGKQQVVKDVTPHVTIENAKASKLANLNLENRYTK